MIPEEAYNPIRTEDGLRILFGIRRDNVDALRSRFNDMVTANASRELISDNPDLGPWIYGWKHQKSFVVGKQRLRLISPQGAPQLIVNGEKIPRFLRWVFDNTGYAFGNAIFELKVGAGHAEIVKSSQAELDAAIRQESGKNETLRLARQAQARATAPTVPATKPAISPSQRIENLRANPPANVLLVAPSEAQRVAPLLYTAVKPSGTPDVNAVIGAPEPSPPPRDAATDAKVRPPESPGRQLRLF